MSMDTQALIDAQTELYGRIACTEENLKKVGSTRLTQGTVEARLQSLDSNWNKFLSNHDALRTAHKAHPVAASNDYFKENLPERVEEMVNEQRGSLLDMIHTLRDKHGEPGKTLPAAQESSSKRKLPNIELPFFSGRIEDWPAFRDLFVSILSRHPMLADVERLHYLKTRVQGEAEERSKNLPTTSDNFKRAWAILEERYENKRVLVRSYLSTFSKMSRMKTESVTDLKKLVNGMLHRGHSGKHRAKLIDSRSRREWEETTDDLRDPPSFDVLKKFLERRLLALEALQTSSGNACATTSAKSTSLSSQSARANLAQKTKQSQCTLCQKEHYIFHCSDFQKKEPAQKKEFAESNKLCFNCFGNHAVTECPLRKSCAACNARHHSYIHDVCISKASSESTASSSASPTSLHVHQFEEKRAAVLLATARVDITDKYGARHTVRALIDPGSEISIASEALAQLLRLPRLPASVSIFGVGGQQTGTTKG
ncbi:uncharacterized protein LOC105202633 [Solenopsis invicta]|uniref:uncharacterized protein LOC105202633 n=1 Tax=Solenopsis invicta TaxID=13686 RepID=UPI00059634CA|nr:uncharacterized protein LOC105202633 [Solenopsis invicta]